MPTIIPNSAHKHPAQRLPRSGDRSPNGATPQPGWLSRFPGVKKLILNFIAPVGYEDAEGFHYGKPLAGQQMTLSGDQH